MAERMGIQFGLGKLHGWKKCCVKYCRRAINCRTRRPLHVSPKGRVGVSQAGSESGGHAIRLSVFGLLDNTDELSSRDIELIQVLRAEHLIPEVTRLR